MSRMLQAYAVRFADRLASLRARRVQAGVERLLHTARQQRDDQGGGLFPILHQFDLRLQHAALVFHRRVRNSLQETGSIAFLCDSGLGGLARWLRAAGYPARWHPNFEDSLAVTQAQTRKEVLLTTDGPLMDRKCIRHKQIRAFWVSPALTVFEQLELVRREFGLGLRDPRCMRCGGRLMEVDARKVWDRIPPRTRLWLNEYYVCESCDQLFWHGTHWRQIRQRLQTSRSTSPAPH